MNRRPRLVILPPQHLGHELHVGRSIVCDMLQRGFLSASAGDTVITGLPDRKFLYQALFGLDQVYDFSELTENSTPIKPPRTISEYLNIDSQFFQRISRFDGYDLINLKDYAIPSTYCTLTASDEMRAIGYEIPERYFTEEFKVTAKTLFFSEQKEVNRIIPENVPGFVVIHHRYGANLEKLISLLQSFPESIFKVIFTSDVKVVAAQLESINNLAYVDSLQCFATILSDPRCQLLVSEWSGGGQLGQYTLGSQGVICYYYDHYPDVFNFTASHEIWELNSTLGSYLNCWDFKSVTGCRRQHYANMDSLKVSIRNLFMSQ